MSYGYDEKPREPQKKDDYKADHRHEGSAPPPPPYPNPYSSYSPYKPGKRVPNAFLLFICSCVMPGIGYMYLGLIKKGLFYLSCFVLSVYCLGAFGGLLGPAAMLFGFGIVALYAVSFFDGFKIRRDMINGITPEDAIPDFKTALANNKSVVVASGALVLVSMALNFLARIAYRFSSNFGFGFHNLTDSVVGLFSLLIVFYAIITIFGKKRRPTDVPKEEYRDNDFIDKR